MKYHVEVNGRGHEVDLIERLGQLVVTVDGKVLDLSYEEVDDLGQVVVQRGGKSYGLSIEGDENRVLVTLAGYFHEITLEDERERAAHAAERAASKGGGLVTSVMPGIVVELLVKVGARVEKGTPLLILSAMKMQNEISAPQDGIVTALHVAAGEAVGAGAKLVSFGPLGAA